MKDSVLLVEDDPDDLELTLQAFESEGFGHAVEVARDGAEVLRRLRSAEDPPVLLILDLNIPKIQGLEVLAALRGDPRLASLPVVILTSSDDPREKQRAEALGVVDFLRKPLGLAEFGRVVKRLKAILSRILRASEDR